MQLSYNISRPNASDRKNSPLRGAEHCSIMRLVLIRLEKRVCGMIVDMPMTKNVRFIADTENENNVIV